MKLIKLSNHDFKWVFTIVIHGKLKEIDCIIFMNVFLTKPVKIGNGNICILLPIKVQTHSASQNDRLNLSLLKDTYDNAKKWLSRRGGKMVIYELQILGLTLYITLCIPLMVAT